MLWSLAAPSGDLTPESLRGSWSFMILPSVLPLARLRAPVGFHRFEPVEWNGIAPAPGSFDYPTRNFARMLLQVSQEAGLYLDSPRFIWTAIRRIASTPTGVK